MTLYADIIARLDNQTLIELTNRRDSSATSLNTSYLSTICDDVQGIIEVEMGLDYDDASLSDRDAAFQKSMAAQGVLIMLEMYASAEGQKLGGRYDRWIESLRKRRSRKGITVDTNAKADVTADTDEDVPAFDKGYMGKHFTPRIGGSDNQFRVVKDE